ncbi:MerR family transcriptional regulator [Eisenbergiella massiliensis]|uniref:MerR family transcriptional regulator n=2 Tax=Eisenbergiella massiliensis TaxID=1720294 RepID=A0A3E3IQ23_9FIRM|nr:MerR family transcriptional regulator [Eisenbergiella massiliensis]
MQMKINEAAKMTGVTIRTLHYYDQIGLLRPETVTDAGYRLYGEKDMERLSQILFFRELDFPLSQIKEMLDSPSFDRNEALRAQHELLKKKKERLERLIALTERRMEGEKEMSFQEFDSSEIERCKEKYAEEAKERWGHTQAWQESKKRTDGYRNGEWEAVMKESDSIMQAFAQSRELAPESEEVQALVAKWQDFISARYYTCTDEILEGLGQMYTADERFTENIDRFGEGTAEQMSKAIACYVSRRKNNG